MTFEKVAVAYDEGLRNVVDIYHLAQDADGIIWIGSTNDLYRYNGHSTLNVTQQINNKQANLVASRWITAVNVQDEANVLFGTTNGLYALNKESMICEKINYLDSLGQSIDASYVNRLNLINDDIYVTTRDGVFVVDKSTYERKQNYLVKGNSISTNKGTSSDSKSVIYYKEDDELFIPSKSGLISIDRETNKADTFLFAPESSSSHSNLDFHLLGDTLVLGNYKYGIIAFDMKKKVFIKESRYVDDWFRFKSMEYLGNNLYILNAENKGIGIYDYTNHSYHWLDVSPFLKAGKYNFMKDRNGYIWFALRGELYRSNLAFKTDKHPSVFNIDISHVFANGEKVWSSLNGQRVLSIDESQNNISIHFSSTPGMEDRVDHIEYSLNKHEYQQVDHPNTLQLFNLRPGKNNITLRSLNQEGEELSKQSILIHIFRPFYEAWWFIAFVIGLILSMIYLFYRYNKNQYIQKEQIKIEYEKKLFQLENTALRNQINPHFIFNTLNSIKYFSIQKSPEETSDFISNFSKLIRKILENSKKSLISLEEEIATLKNYTDIEALRFHEGFETHFFIDENINTQDFLLPPMIIQPFVENAIWHGLMHKSNDRILTINIRHKGRGIICQIIDNGVGREAAKKLGNAQKHKSSLGMQITRERMDLINEKNQMDNSFEIIDLYDQNGKSEGTQVNIYFKFNDHNS